MALHYRWVLALFVTACSVETVDAVDDTTTSEGASFGVTSADSGEPTTTEGGVPGDDIEEALQPLYFSCGADADCESGHCAATGDGGFCTQSCETSLDCPPSELGGTPAFLCADQGEGSLCLMQCLLHRDEPEQWPGGFGAVCPDGWVCRVPSAVEELEGRHQSVCFEEPVRPG